jgi:hypothetical protein
MVVAWNLSAGLACQQLIEYARWQLKILSMNFNLSRKRNWGKGIILSITLIFSFLCHPVFAAPISRELAKRVALTQVGILESNMAHKGALTPASARTVTEVSTLFGEQSQPLAYVISLSPKGYVVISPDTDIRPVIAYSANGKFPFEESKENVLLHLVKWDMKNRLDALPVLSENFKEKNSNAWDMYLAGSEILLEESSDTNQWGPWITTTWHQHYPYNKYCPIDPETGDRSVVGCTATAAAQIIDYWKYPTSLSFDEYDRYATDTRGIKIDEDHDLYDFPSFEALNQMLFEIDYNNEDDISALNFAVGISVRMDYTSTASSSSLSVSDLVSKFGYSSAADYYGTSAVFYDVLQNDMKRGNPAWVHVFESDSDEPGHAIVVDGYKDTGEYHVNFGWGLYCVGWYFFPEGLPSGYNAVFRGVLKIYPYVSDKVLHVDGDVTTSGDGHDWENAYKTLDEAIAYSYSGDEIWIKKGTYLLEDKINIENGLRIKSESSSLRTFKPLIILLFYRYSRQLDDKPFRACCFQ